jgi:hypothetical protein
VVGYRVEGGHVGVVATWGDRMPNTHGAATAITVMTPVKRGWRSWLLGAFWLGQNISLSTLILRKLSFIHFARWCIVRDIPYNGPPQERETLNYNYLLFESNFNGTWDQYIDAFSHIVPAQMKMVWGSSWGFPGPVPVGPFKDYIRRNEYEANHYYSAYPDATTTMIASSLTLEERFAEFDARAQGLDDAQLQQEWLRFITDMQRHL